MNAHEQLVWDDLVQDREAHRAGGHDLTDHRPAHDHWCVAHGGRWRHRARTCRVGRLLTCHTCWRYYADHNNAGEPKPGRRRRSDAQA
jgi:hypothetical protein